MQFERLAEALGEEGAAWARFHRGERERKWRGYQESYNTPNHLAVQPPALDGNKYNP